MKPAHDGAIAVVKDRELLFCLESEKDSYPRHTELTPMTITDALERVGEVPDVIAVGGWEKAAPFPYLGSPMVESGYMGIETSMRETMLCGKPVKRCSSSHVRGHIMMAAGMAPEDDATVRAVLVWEGRAGSFYLLDDRWEITREIPVLEFPGGRYELLYAIAHPGYPDSVLAPKGDEPGKLMALAAYGDPDDADPDIIKTVEQLLTPDGYAPKGTFKDSPLYNAGVEADVTKIAAAILQERMFEIFARAAKEEIPPDVPLYINGGCGLNCDWNTMWRELGHFSSVFVPPCTNDSGSAVGHALDALHAVTGDPRVSWSVYCGLDFEWDTEPEAMRWQRRPVDEAALSDALASGRIVAWVQGRWELGPRALGNRSLLADPFNPGTRDRLNDIKQREGYRPIAPVCRLEDAGKVFDTDFHDPYMLYFRMVTSPDLGAVTHVDGSARVQTVTSESNGPLHDLLSVFAERHGVGVLCNTSLNFKTLGFINRMSDLVHYCQARDIDDMVVGDTWLQQVAQPSVSETPVSV
jgi:hydroxymethyl cephem carbamoyltransferase